MSRHRPLGLWLALGAWAGLGPPPAAAQLQPGVARVVRMDPARAELAMLQALRANPVTAPYLISASVRDGRLVLSGVVGTKQIHDLVVRIAITTGYPIGDDLVIDTAAAHRVAAMPTAWSGGPAGSTLPAFAAGGVPSLGASPYGLPYIYPPPLFGRLDDPFFGFEPPILSYAPWFRAAAAARGPLGAVAGAPAPMGAGPAAAGAVVAADPAAAPMQVPLGPSPDDGAVEMTLDSRGFAVLRGTVPSLADRIAVGQRVAQVPGVVEVLNLLTVGRPAVAVGNIPAARVGDDQPPPPPRPEPAPALGPQGAPAAQAPAVQADAAPAAAPVAVVGDELSRRAAQAIARRPALAGTTIKVSVLDGVVTLSGQVPSAYEAMLAFRAVEQTPGVERIIDRLEFVVPDGDQPNPLLAKGRPEDVEPYLAAQLRRNIGDLAHVDQVHLRGHTLEIRGTLARPGDRPRLEAILHSMPLLRGFRLEPTFDEG